VLDIDEFTNRYVTIWSEADPVARGEAVARLWSADGLCCTQAAEHSGREAIEARVAAAHDKWVAQQGYVFRALGAAEAHHGGVRLAWEMVPAEGGPAATTGVQFLILDDDDLVRYDYQFIDS
jgi:uncharacterized protein